MVDLRVSGFAKGREWSRIDTPSPLSLHSFSIQGFGAWHAGTLAAAIRPGEPLPVSLLQGKTRVVFPSSRPSPYLGRPRLQVSVEFPLSTLSRPRNLDGTWRLEQSSTNAWKRRPLRPQNQQHDPCNILHSCGPGPDPREVVPSRGRGARGYVEIPEQIGRTKIVLVNLGR